MSGLILALAVIVVAIVVILPLLLILAVAVWVGARRGKILATVAGAALMLAWLTSPLPHVGAGALYVGVPSVRPSLVELDLAMSRSARLEIVRLAETGALEAGEWSGDFRLPERARGLSVHGTIDVVNESCGSIVFFMTLTGFSPDPYAGFEYVPAGCQPEADPLGSGQGTWRDLGGGWYWIEAS